jgi:hypothetical protein
MGYLYTSPDMAWTSNGFFRNVNLLKSFDSSSGSDLIDFYQPGTLNPNSLINDVRYSGFITTLRLQVYLDSIAEIVFPIPEVGQDEAEISAIMRGVEAAAPKKQIAFFLRSSDSESIKIGSINLVNRKPYYTVDLLIYFTDAAAFDVGSDVILSAQFVNAGFGLLDGTDRVSLHGSAVEEGENTAPSLNINIFGMGDGSGGSTGGNVVVTTGGEVITNNAGSIVET